MYERILITGASRGIGAGLARRLACAGATIGLVARHESELQKVAESLEARGCRALTYPVDVGDTAAMKEACARFLGQVGCADLVVANAGIDRHRLGDADLEATVDVLRTNVIGVANTVVPFIPSMLVAGSGTLAAVGSIAGFRALPRHAAYCASKAAVNTFMDGLRMDLAGSGVHAMTLCPGFVHTAMTREASHPMPFALTVDAAVDEILRALDRRARTHAFPRGMRALRRVMALAPEGVLRRVVAHVERQRPFSPRAEPP